MGRTEPPGAVWAAVSVSGCSDRRHPWVGGGGSLGLRGAVGVAPRAVPTWDPALVWGWGVGRGCEEPLGDPPLHSVHPRHHAVRRFGLAAAAAAAAGDPKGCR